MRKYNKNKILERNILTKKERTNFFFCPLKEMVGGGRAQGTGLLKIDALPKNARLFLAFTRFKTPYRFSAYINETGCSIIYSIYIILEQIVSYKYVCIRF